MLMAAVHQLWIVGRACTTLGSCAVQQVRQVATVSDWAHAKGGNGADFAPTA